MLHFAYPCCFFVVFTTIEFGIMLPFVLHGLGIDSLATLFTYIAVALGIIPQIPKRFIWRSRPYMVGRAIKLNKAGTSSFPSRAVTVRYLNKYYIQQ